MYLYSLLIISSLLFAKSAYAICPICMIAVGAGVGIAEELGVNDIIIGLWVGALIVSVAWWTVNWFIKKKWNFKWRGPIIFISYYLLILVSLYYSGLIGKELNTIWGIDKLLFGIILGSAVFYGEVRLHFYLKVKNSNKVYFPFQKVFITLVGLIIVSRIFYFLIK